jgi:cation diffusion facilitator family transporter
VHVHDSAGVPEQHFGERRSRIVLLLTAATMLLEIVAGTITGSMALLADGWHMATHVAAFAITLFAYRYAARHRHDPRFVFGTGKVNALGAFASAVALAVVALMMALESLERIVTPHAIRFDEALVVAAFGLVVNAVSAFLLHGGGLEGQHRHDQNLRAAYLHVLADALTSILAIVALALGRTFGWSFLDPLMGIVGAAVIMRWSLGLLKTNSAVLLDRSVDEEIRAAIRERVEATGGTRVRELRAWRVGPQRIAAALRVHAVDGETPAELRERLASIDELAVERDVVLEVDDAARPRG